MRIATLCFSRTVGGLELAVLRKGAELKRHGHEVIAILPPDADGLRKQAEAMGLEVATVGATLPYLDLPAARKLSTIFIRRSIELVLVARGRDLSTAMLAAGKNIAVVLFQQMQSGVDKHDWFHNKIFRRLDGCVVITEALREQMIANTVIDPERITVASYGIDTERFSPDALDRESSRREFTLPADAFVVGIVGGFNPGKGQDDLLEALQLAAERDRSLADTLYGLFVGERPDDASDYTSALRTRRAQLSLADRIVFHPFLDDPRIAFRALDVFVLASHSETFGMVLQEAIAMGIPSIGTDAGGVPEIITHGLNGLLVPPRDPSAIADAVISLYHNPEMRRSLVREGVRRTRERYDMDQQYQVFENALARARGVRNGIS